MNTTNVHHEITNLHLLYDQPTRISQTDRQTDSTAVTFSSNSHKSVDIKVMAYDWLLRATNAKKKKITTKFLVCIFLLRTGQNNIHPKIITITEHGLIGLLSPRQRLTTAVPPKRQIHGSRLLRTKTRCLTGGGRGGNSKCSNQQRNKKAQ